MSDETPVKSWELPTIEDPRNGADDGTTDVFNRRRDWKYEPPEEEIEILPPTAQEIEAIRSDAQADGFTQGQQEGYAQGLQEGQTQGHEQGLAKGLEEGTAQGLAAGQEQIDTHLAALAKLIENLQKPVAKVDKNLEKELVLLAVSLARAVIRTEVKTNEDLIFQALSEGLKVLPIQESRYQIHLNPADITLVTAHFSAEEIEKHHWNLIENPSFSRGGCEIITDSNAVDVTVERRVRDVLDRFLLEQGLGQVDVESEDPEL
ncbi:flagellar assembly protein FliH [Paraglaciecola hydrolytica]|uniref:Flagellar assembly protein FliH n=1 Tax=Paraglaciecola hydrolytica TaxID=1799789 RepID=A0A148KNS1_9ALTE|nr:flagellar assembly protein FliH [Paraglaciecola hydrolytica]KXI27931.1 flagellar assembly protein FliH [Paraglaciecola hydrolytica]